MPKRTSIWHRGSTVALLFGVVAMILVVVIQAAVTRQIKIDHETLVSRVSATALGSVRQSGMALADLSSQSRELADSLAIVVYHLQLADDSLMVLQYDSRFSSNTLQGLSEQLTTARVELQSMILGQKFDRLDIVKQRVVSIAEQFPADGGTKPAETLISVLNNLHLP